MDARRVSSFRHWVALAALAASGCSKDATETNGLDIPGGGDEPLVSGPLCPGCGPLAGGESSDFEGDQHVCASFRAERRVSDAEATALGFDMAALRERATREFSGPLRWVETASTPGRPATGFTAQTSVSGAVRPSGELRYMGLDPELCDAEGNCRFSADVTEPCATYAEFLQSSLDIELDIETADGAIEAITLPGVIRLERGSLPTVVRADFDIALSEVSGTLQLDAERPGPQLGTLAASLALWPDVVRGNVAPIIVPDEPGARRIAGDDTPYAPSWRYQPVSAEWPPDGCGLEAVPVDAESARGRAAIERLAADYPAAQAFVNMASPMAANWDDVRMPGRDGPAAQLGIELADDPEFRCVEADGSATFDTEVHVWTSDGRLDWTTQMRGALFSRTEDTPGLVVSTDETLDADATFWSSSLRDVDLLGAQSVVLQFRSSFGLDSSNAYVDGSISAELLPADCSLDWRCIAQGSTSECTDCGTPLDVDYLYWSFFR